jgi:hypothetical protein
MADENFYSVVTLGTTTSCLGAVAHRKSTSWSTFSERTSVARFARSLSLVAVGATHARLRAARLCGDWPGPERGKDPVAGQEAENEGAAVECIVGHMGGSQLPAPVDLACYVFDSIDGLYSMDDFVHTSKRWPEASYPRACTPSDRAIRRETGLIAYGLLPLRGPARWLQGRCSTGPPTCGRTPQTADVEIVIRVED